MRSAAKANSAKVPTKHEPASTNANREREETSIRAKVRRNIPSVSLTNQWLALSNNTESDCKANCASPAVRKSHVPTSSSLVRMLKIASSNSRAICKGYQFAPAGSMPAIVLGTADLGACTVNVAVRLARSIATCTYSYVRPSGLVVLFKGVNFTPLPAAAAPARLLCAA